MVDNRDDNEDEMYGRIGKSIEGASVNKASSSQDGGGVHNRLYARSQAMQEEGRERRQQIAKSLAPKPFLVKKITEEEAESLFGRLHNERVQKLIALGRKTEEKKKMNEEKKISPTLIAVTDADDLYSRLYKEAKEKQLKEIKLAETQNFNKVKTISNEQANTLYERLYLETTLSTQRARDAVQ